VSEDGWRLSEGEQRAWIDGLIASGRRLVAPTDDGGLVLFRAVDSPDAVRLDFANTRWSPKEFLFPATEELFSFRLAADGVSLVEAPADEGEQVLFGLRPCDAAGLMRLDDVFLGSGGDPAYASRRERTTVVSLACDSAQPECFCTAVGGSPAGTDGSDLQLVRLPDAGTWLLRALTDRGSQLVATAASAWAPAVAADWEAAAAQQAEVEGAIHRSPIAAEWATTLEQAFAHPLWDVVGERCLGCGVCAYVCPSCSCFDVSDSGAANCGTRCKSWDSCGFSQFTRHASGHNPRSTQAARYRQRVLHKFSYFPLEHDGRLMCVGCGRCTVLCPVGLDIHQTVGKIAAAAGAGEPAP
jgi:ferredoxin